MSSIEIRDDDIFVWDDVFEDYLGSGSAQMDETCDENSINESGNVCKLGSGFFGDILKFSPRQCREQIIIVKKTKYINTSNTALQSAVKKKLLNGMKGTDKLVNLVKFNLNDTKSTIKSKKNEQYEKELMNEAAIVLKLNNTKDDARKDHILKGYGITTDVKTNRIFFFSKYYKKKSIDDYWTNMVKEESDVGNKHKRDQLFKLPFDVLSGLNFLHEQEFIHLDIACRNIFYDDNTYVIGDFGLCKEYKEGNQKIEPGSNVPPFYTISNGHNLNVSYYIDYISFGCMLLELLLLINNQLIASIQNNTTNNNNNNTNNNTKINSTKYEPQTLWTLFRLLYNIKAHNPVNKETFNFNGEKAKIDKIYKQIEDDEKEKDTRKRNKKIKRAFINTMLKEMGNKPTYSNNTKTTWSASVEELIKKLNNNKPVITNVFGNSDDANDEFYKVVEFYAKIIDKVFNFDSYDEIGKGDSRNINKLGQIFKMNTNDVKQWSWVGNTVSNVEPETEPEPEPESE